MWKTQGRVSSIARDPNGEGIGKVLKRDPKHWGLGSPMGPLPKGVQSDKSVLGKRVVHSDI